MLLTRKNANMDQAVNMESIEKNYADDRGECRDRLC